MIELPKWQQDLLDKLSTTSNPRTMFMAGRRIGKSKTLQWAKTLEQFVQGFRMETSEGTVFGQTYYCVKPMGWIWREFEWKDMVAWCEENMERSPDTITPNLRWYVNGEQFWFRDERDRTMFVMKWV